MLFSIDRKAGPPRHERNGDDIALRLKDGTALQVDVEISCL